MAEPFFSNVLIKMWGEDKPQPVVVSVGHVQENQNTEDFDFDSMVYFYFQDYAEYMSAFRRGWSDGFSGPDDSQFYIIEELD